MVEQQIPIAECITAESNNWFRTMVLSSLDGIVLFDSDGLIIEFNPAAEQIFGHPREALLSRPLLDLIPPRLRDVQRIRFDEILRQPKSRDLNRRIELEGLHADGREVPIEVSIAPLPSPSGTRFAASIRDVSASIESERRRAQRSLLHTAVMETTSHLMGQGDLKESIHRSLADVGEVLDVAHACLFRGPPTMESIHCSSAWHACGLDFADVGLTALNWAEAQWLLADLQDGHIVAIDDTGDLPPAQASLFAERGVRSVLLLPVFVADRLESFIAFDDTRRTRAWQEDEVNCLRSMAHSFARVIERTQTEREMRHAGEQLREALTRAEAGSRAKSEFLASVSHEIRTPMTAIVGYSDLLMRPDTTEEQKANWCQLICRNANFLLGLINDILDLSKIEAGQMSLSPAEVDIDETIDAAVSSLQSLATEKNLDLRVRFHTAVPPAIIADPIRLSQILVNLVSNGLKFTAEGGVTVNVEFHDTDTPSRSVMRIAVTDTGIGIAQDQIDKLFNSFTQVHDSQKKYGGTGLGLAISRKLARMMGGDIEVTSQLRIGTTFTVTVPVEVVIREQRYSGRHKAVSDAAPEPAPESKVAGKRVLLVDDTKDNREIFRFILSDAAVDVTTAVNGQEACERVLMAIADNDPYDMVFMDMNMPIMDGYTATKTLREEGVTTPILALTAFAMADDAAECIGAGCDAYLTKPIRGEDLIAAVAKWTGDERDEDLADEPPAASPVTTPTPIAATPTPTPTPTPNDTGEDLLQSELPERPEMQELLTAYRVGIRVTRDAIEECWNTSDAAKLRSLTHQVKSSAGCYGFPQVSVVAAAAETALREEQPLETIEDTVMELLRLLDRVSGPR